MAFTWTDTVSASLVIRNQYMIEMQTNIDHIYDVQTPPHTRWTWVENPSGAGPGIGTINETEDWQEIRDALDHIVDNLSCSSHNASHDLTVYTGHLNVLNATKYGTHLNGNRSAENASQLASRDSGHLTGYYYGDNRPYYSGQCTSNCPSHCPYTKTAQYTTVKTNYCVPHYNTLTRAGCSIVCTSHKF